MNNALTDYSISDAPMNMDIRSETLEPISGLQGTSKRFVFRLDQAGYLDKNSLLLFKAQAVGGANGNLRANLWNGGLGAIKRITLKVGDYIINDVIGADILSTLLTLSKQNPNVKNSYNGWYYQNCLHIKALDEADNDAGATKQIGADVNGGIGTIIMDKPKCGMDMGDDSASQANAKIHSCSITNDASNNVQFGIPLGAILPAIRNRTLPLFLFQQYRILIEVEFNTADKWCNRKDRTDGAAPNGGADAGLQATSADLTYHDVKLQIDYVIMPSAVQNADQDATNKQGGLNLTFLDAIRVEKQIVANPTAQARQELEHRIGMENKEVHKIYMVKKFNDHSGKQRTRILGEQRIDGVCEEDYNVNIDGIDVFPEKKFSVASHYDETSNCLEGDLKVERPLYYNDINSLYSGLGSELNGTSGVYKPLCLDLTNGEPAVVGGGRMIGSYPIIWKYARRPTSAIANSVMDENGAMNVEYYCLVSKTANITATPAGTQVVVSY